MHLTSQYLGTKVRSLFQAFLGLVMVMMVTACQAGGEMNSLRAAQLSMEGEQLRKQGSFQLALEKQQEALQYVDANSDPGVTGIILNNLGLAYSNLGNYSEALKAFETAVDLHKQVNDPKAFLHEGETLDNMGSVYQQLGQLSKALEMHQAALKLFEQVNSPGAAGIALNNIAVIYRKTGDNSSALAIYEKALSISQATNDLSNQFAVLNNMGIVYTSLKDPSRALDAYQKSLEVARVAKDRVSEANALLNLAAQYKDMPEERSKALEMSQRALSILKEVGARPDQVNALGTIAQIYTVQNQKDLAISSYRQAIDITESIRRELRQSNKENERSYTEINSGLYRQLAELLNQSGKSGEAEAVLGLLKE